jgi:protein arginine N-methyltransferase 1
VLPLFNGHLRSVIDARTRLLAPGGTLIPAADTLYAAVVELPEKYGERLPPFSADGTVKLDVLQRFMTNTWEKVRCKPEQLLTKPEPRATIDNRTVSGDDFNGTVRLTAHRAGRGHGLAVWFDATLSDGVTFSNAPDQPELVYGAAFFPWTEPVDVRQGDAVCVQIDARHVGDDYVWRWNSDVFAGDASTPKARFQQSTFYGQPLATAKLAKGAAAEAVVVSEDGQVEKFVLQAMDGAATNQTIARALMDRFPRRFPDFNDALGRVGSVARRFGAD